MNRLKFVLTILLAIPLGLACFDAAAMKCDVDEDADIDRNDISTIFKDRGQPALDSNDPRDADNNMLISIIDGRICQKQCTLPKCAEPEPQATHSDFVVHIDVSDANPNTFGIAESVKLQFIGPDLVDSEVKTVSQLQLSEPLKLATLYLRTSPQEMQDIKIIAKADGYVDTGTSVIVVPELKTYRVSLKMLKDSDGEVAPGIHVNNQSIEEQVDAGIVVQTIHANNGVEDGSPVVSVSIPMGVQMLDADGNSVDAVNLKIVSFDPYEPAALAAYPGGLDVVADASGFSINGQIQTSEREINFKSAGFVAINIVDAQGTKVKRFSQDIEVAQQFKVGTRDAAGAVVQIGDQVPIWSYDEDTGKWTYEKEGIVQDRDVHDGMYDIVYAINHLTFFNLDWHFGDKCTSAEFVLNDKNGVPLGPEQLEDLHFYLTIQSAPAIGRWSYSTIPADNLIKFLNAPRGFSGSLSIFDKSRVEKLGQVYFFNICGDTVPRYDITVDSDDSLTYEKAKDMVALLLNQPESVKQMGVDSIRGQIQRLLAFAASLLNTGDERGNEIFSDASDVIVAFSGAFLENLDTIYEQRLLSGIGFIDRRAAFGGLDGYGCLHPEVQDTLLKIVDNLAEYSTFRGDNDYSLGDSLLLFLERAAREFIAFTPTNLAYTAKGVSAFVACGYELIGSLLEVGYDSSDQLDQEILFHFEPVVLANVRQMRADVDNELAFVGGDSVFTTGIISFSTAATFDFILQDALLVATELSASGIFSANGVAEINANIAYLQQLRNDGKVEPPPSA